MPVMAESKKFRDIQYAFTRHIRDPEHQPAPEDVEERRMEIYRGLLYRNVESFIAQSFPVLRKITPHDRWHSMLRDYFKCHIAHTPLFPKMPREFLHYLEKERAADDDPAFLAELAHYEWVELALIYDNRELSLQNCDTDGDLLAGIPALNPITFLLSYKFPVHRISPDYQPGEPPDQPTYLVVYRDRNDNVGFMELNPVSARLLELVSENRNVPGRVLLESIADEIRHPNTAVVISGGLDIMKDLQRKDILLGVKAS